MNKLLPISIYYILPLVINFIYFKFFCETDDLTSGDYIGVGILTFMPIVNWLGVMVLFFKFLGRLVLS